MIIIGDVGGQYSALLALLAKMPIGEPIILLGDLNDRGPESRQVIEFAMSNNNVRTLNSNHQDGLVDHWLSIFEPDYERRYSPEQFFTNGGQATLESYGAEKGMNPVESASLIPAYHIQWLRSLPGLIETEELLLSHAPILAELPIEEVKKIPHEAEHSLLWARNAPSPRSKFQIFGHNSHWGLMWLDDFAVCLDASKQNVLTGLHWPSKRIYQQYFG